MINSCTSNWDFPGHFSFIRPGTYVPFIPGGVDTCLAEVLGYTRDREQIVLMFKYHESDPATGQYVLTRRIFQRDRKTIEDMYKESRYG